ncbi:MAG TPA: EamA family transporter [Candidatus Omnitrophota bacterium]|nr:EamA family transporter [Candidatus Omnitrophota bacterium]HPS19972.1 EamA family transporter [Candidatus Omnitrophota bacterium]
MLNERLTFKVFFLIILNDIGDTLSQLIMKKGLIQTGIDSVTFGNIVEFIARNSTSLLLWIGILIYTLNFFIWIAVLYKVDLSVAMPVGSTCYILVPIAAVIFLGEHVGLLRWIGIALIILGIHFVTQSKNTPRKVASCA